MKIVMFLFGWMEKGKRCPQISRGQVTMFGFKKPSPPSGATRGVGLPTEPSLPSETGGVLQETIERLVIVPVHPRQGSSKLARAKKDGTKSTNRFGFRPPSAMSKVADINQSDSKSESDFRQSNRPQSTPALKLASKQRSMSEPRCNNKSSSSASASCVSNVPASPAAQQVSGKYALKTSRLPLPQSATYRPTSAVNGVNGIGPQADKLAKTKANNQRAAQSKQFYTTSAPNTSSSSPTDSGFGGQKPCRNDNVLEIQQLEHSPNMAHKFRNFHHQKARPMEMVFTDGRTKQFELRDVQPSRSAASSEDGGIGRAQQLAAGNSPARHPLRQATNRSPLTTSSSSSSGDEVFDEVSNEEKQSRDKLSSEKVRLGCSPEEEDTANLDEEDEETMWGRGEAMALDEQLPCANMPELDQSPGLRSVLLTIEDPEFANLAVMDQSASMLEDEVLPESPDISCSETTSVEPLPPPPNLADAPGSPGTPTNSFSSDAKDRDFLIDDEIADQPGLVFDTEGSHRLRKDGVSRTETSVRSEDNIDLLASLNADDASILNTSRTISRLAGEVSQVLANMNGSQVSCRNGRPQRGSVTSLNTLSPCESLASDDLMLDHDISAQFDELHELEDAPLRTEIMSQSNQVLQEWSSLLSTHPGLSNGASARTPPRPIRPMMRHTTSGSASPSNVTPAHSRVQVNSSCGESASGGAYTTVKRETLDQMAQDVAYLKSVLVTLKIVLEEVSETEQKRVVDDHDRKNLLYTGLAASEAVSAPGEGATSPQLADLQRQIVLLNAQLEERDSRLARQEEAMRRLCEARPQPTSPGLRVNVATQTDRIRPLSSGPTLFQTSPDNTPTSFVSGIEVSPFGLPRHVLPMYRPNKRITDGSKHDCQLKHNN
ncbi:uncharacterized protein isoform X4 [Rhodnius prolixus]|uniref:uncharacterized protein isoform X4 n=1 Tax=Rhodnius prolixus TaxID=13249 RepID=UPI003D18C461